MNNIISILENRKTAIEMMKIKSNTFYGPGYRFCEIDWKHAVDIDNYEDLEFAKAVFMLK